MACQQPSEKPKAPSMRRIFVPLTKEEMDAAMHCTLNERIDCSTREQLRYIIREGLIARGYLKGKEDSV